MSKKQYTCCICLEDLKNYDAFYTPCLHRFHTDCIQQWLDQKKYARRIDCPACRTDIGILLGENREIRPPEQDEMADIEAIMAVLNNDLSELYESKISTVSNSISNTNITEALVSSLLASFLTEFTNGTASSSDNTNRSTTDSNNQANSSRNNIDNSNVINLLNSNTAADNINSISRYFSFTNNRRRILPLIRISSRF